jgi:tetratricopeptide (TPR) repeat protein
VSRWRPAGWLACLAAALALPPLSAGLQARAPAAPPEARPVLPQAAVLRPALLGFHPLVADLYWLRSVQYIGAHLETDQRFPHLHALVDLVTSLDPHFLDAYTLGGLFLVMARQYSEAVAVYEKGVASNPHRWELPYDLGRLYFLELKDDDKALAWWLVADQLPGRPDYLPRFIARLHARTGALETALELWHKIAEESDNAWVRQRAKEEVERLVRQIRRSRGRGVAPEGT